MFGFLIALALTLWVAAAIRAARRRKGRCSGDCAACPGCKRT